MKLTNVLHVFLCIFMVQTLSKAQNAILPIYGNAERSEYVPNAPRVQYESFHSNTVGRLPQIQERDKAKTYTSAMPEISQPVNISARNSEITGIAPIIDEQFVANNLSGFYPSDNTMAISNDGYILSADYATIAFYKENGVNGTFIQDYEWPIFYNAVPGLTNDFFDPRLIYDNVADRFILVTLNGFNSAVSKIVVSFSTNNQPSSPADWNHYAISTTSFHNTMWFDYPNIGISDEDLFVTGNMFTNDMNAACNISTSQFQGNKIFQIRKADGYAGVPLNKLEWNDIKDPDGTLATTLVPVTYGQGGAFGPGIYLVSTYWFGWNEVYYYRITGGVGAGTQLLPPNEIATAAYAPAFNATQTSPLGGQDPNRLDAGDNRIQNAFYLNQKIHFVFTEQGSNINNQFGAISYNIIDLAANPATNTRYILDLSTQAQACAYPSIASFGTNNLDESVMIGFLRSGDNMYPQVSVVNFDAGTFTPQMQIPVVQQGLGIVNLECDNAGNPCCAVHFERWGDYTGIQRRYNQHRVWMVGAYAFGTNPNSGGSTDGWNAYVAEIGDGGPVGVEQMIENQGVKIYPNPANDNITVLIDRLIDNQLYKLKIFDITGRCVKEQIFQKTNNNATFVVETDVLTSGIYQLNIQTNNNSIYHEKFAIVH